MKFQVQMKDPDTLYDAVNDAIRKDVDESITDADERDAVIEVRGQKVRGLCAQWFRYGEYLTVEIDTDAGTCVVVPTRS